MLYGAEIKGLSRLCRYAAVIQRLRDSRGSQAGYVQYIQLQIIDSQCAPMEGSESKLYRPPT